MPSRIAPIISHSLRRDRKSRSLSRRRQATQRETASRRPRCTTRKMPSASRTAAAPPPCSIFTSLTCGLLDTLALLGQRDAAITSTRCDISALYRQAAVDDIYAVITRRVSTALDRAQPHIPPLRITSFACSIRAAATIAATYAIASMYTPCASRDKPQLFAAGKALMGVDATSR